MLRFLRFAALGAALVYFFDPQNGRRRRALAKDRIPAFFRGKARQAERVGRTARSQAYGVTQKVKHRSEDDKPQPDDATLAHKVETEIFRDAEVPKGRINVNAENGVVVLRGEVEQPELISDLEKKTRNVQGVREVENLLHTPGTQAPLKS
jgi:osmotically-inducible protein OsmY